MFLRLVERRTFVWNFNIAEFIGFQVNVRLVSFLKYLYLHDFIRKYFDPLHCVLSSNYDDDE